MRPVLFYFSAVVMCVCQPWAMAEISSKWKLNETYLVDVQHVSRQEINIPGNASVTNTTIHMIFKVRPTRVDKDGTVLLHTIVTCDDVSTKTGGQPEKDSFKGLRNQEFEIALSPGNRQMEVNGAAKMVEPMFGASVKDSKPEERKFLENILTYLLRLHLGQAYPPTPGPTTGIGDQWHHVVEMQLQPLCALKADRTYTLLGRQTVGGKEMDKIGWTSEVDIKPLKDDSGALPFTIKSVTPTNKLVDEGTILWDVAAGQPARIEFVQKSDIDMVLGINKGEVKGSAKSTDSFVIQFLDKMPEEK